MAIELLRLSAQNEPAYATFLNECAWAMFFHSLGYRRLLKSFLPTWVEDHYIIAIDNKRLIGALPTFICDGPLGPVLNSLPFFGSHGSILLGPGAEGNVADMLSAELAELCSTRNVTFATVIETPFSDYNMRYNKAINTQFQDKRIGQLTYLPQRGGKEEVEQALMKLYHQKTRNIVRKAIQSSLTFCWETSLEALRSLYELHSTNVAKLGGVSKPWKFFECITNTMTPDTDYRVYTARTKKGEVVCAMLLFYHRSSVEYFVPATKTNWRSEQPLSALIHLAMMDAVNERSASIWNWGGTWPSQDGVYHFKSRWGTYDREYHYYTGIPRKQTDLSDVTRETLLQEYPWFYTVPFAVLEEKKRT